ncbi:hypothetical protein [Dechloromonas sp. H13]|uniref:hypothetical protein n=1 Tax=Dechloromonas sp. H13 TaxID=2570193 RepID=UPI001291A8EF|nr:hypothetical protein [Dechloromonas sp. H13]
MNLAVTSHAHLERMKCRMDEGTEEALFYAALELRCGVEARMREYVEAIDGIPESEKKQWHVAKLGRSLANAYRTGDKVMIFVFIFPEDGSEMQLSYMPVMARLQKIVEQLGDYMHAAKPARAAEAGWIDNLRDLLNEAYPLLLLATSGELVGLPLVNEETGKLKVNAVLKLGDPRASLLTRMMEGARPTVSVIHIEPTGPITFYEN